MKEQSAALITKLRATKPLIHHITNYVTVNDCANITLAVGASPIMADARAEAADIAAIASAVVLNMGTLNEHTVLSMLDAGTAANAAGIPVIFDPVGAGASAFRNETAARLLEQVKFTVVRGNISEIRFLAGKHANTKGVDAADSDVGNAADAVEIASKLAGRLNCVVAITGAVDVVSDVNNTYCLSNGHPALANISGTGCMCSSLIGSFCGAAPDTPLAASIGALLSMGIAGEIAWQMAGSKGNGSFHEAIHNAMSQMNAKTLIERGELNEA